uniref:RNA binding motif protein 12B n=1 Tax=Iconisemion striatum TaxID=60296 RepID=A0A1A7XK17_9TELE
MTVILLLRGLNVKASAEDIRSFFKSLHIPDGGVYIVGGSLQEAFIAFSTERDAQLAMRRTGSVLKGSPVTLHISSMAELEQRLNSLLKKKSHPNSAACSTSPHEDRIGNFSPPAVNPPAPASASPVYDQPKSNAPGSGIQPMDSSTAFLLGMCTVLKGLQTSNVTVPSDVFCEADNIAEVKTPEHTLNSRPGYVRLFGLPASTSKEDICHFFQGLAVQEAIVNVELGVNRGCLVKFAKMKDANAALGFNKQSLGSICVEVRGADEKMWTSVLQECEETSDFQVIQNPDQHSIKQSAKRDYVPVQQLKRKTPKQFPPKPSKRLKPDVSRTSSPSEDYTVMVKNLPENMTKTDIKQLLGCPNVPHKNVLHLLDQSGNRTDKAFLVFNCLEDFDYAINLSGCHVGSGAIEVLSITRQIMNEMLSKSHRRLLCSRLRDPRKCRQRIETKRAPSPNLDQTAQMCIFVRNMPADVQRNKIKRLFCKFEVEKNNIVLLRNRNGNGTGEAVVMFPSEQLVSQALKINGSEFLGTKLFLTPITVKQMNDILAKH